MSTLSDRLAALDSELVQADESGLGETPITAEYFSHISKEKVTVKAARNLTERSDFFKIGRYWSSSFRF